VTRHRGPAGRADLLDIPDRPDCAQTTAHWLIDAPIYSPAWSQYLLFVVRLDDDVPGFPPPKRHFDGATHEFAIWTIDPGSPVTAEQINAEHARGRPCLTFLSPVNALAQFEATDD